MENKLVVVADVPVALVKVKFWRVEEPVARILPNVPRPEMFAVVPKRFVKVPVVEKKFVVVAEVPVAFVNIRSVRLRTFANKLVNVPDVEKRLVVVAEVPVALVNDRREKTESSVVEVDVNLLPRTSPALVTVNCDAPDDWRSKIFPAPV